MAAEPTVSKVTQTSTFSGEGKLQQTYLVQFMVGADGPFSISVPAAQFNTDQVKKQMAEVADTLNKLPRG